MTTSTNGHPTDEELRAWLDQDDAVLVEDSGTTEHLNLCDRCATLIERLADDQPTDAESDARLREALTAAVAPPPDLADRLRGRMRERERNRQELNEVLRLFALPAATMNALSTDRSRTRRPGPSGDDS